MPITRLIIFVLLSPALLVGPFADATALKECTDIVADDVRKPSVEKPAIGVLLETGDGEKVLSLGSYIGGLHQRLIMNVHESEIGPVKKVLWAGELVFENDTDGNRVILAANETSGFVYGLARAEPIPEELEGLNFSEASSSSLVGFKSEKVFVSKGFVPLKYSEDAMHIFPGLDVAALAYRHDMTNAFAEILAILELIQIVPSYEISERSFSSVLRIIELIDAFKRTEFVELPENVTGKLSLAEQKLKFYDKKGKIDWTEAEFIEVRKYLFEINQNIYDETPQLVFIQK